MKKYLLPLLSMILSMMATGCASSKEESAKVTIEDEFPLYECAAPGSESWDWPELRLDNPADGQTYVANVTVPTLKAFLPEENNRTGAAMIVCPGGGHQILSYSTEGTNVAQWLAEHGITAFVLKYRLIHFADTNEGAFWYVLGLPEPQADPGANQEEVLAHRSKAIELSNDDGRAAIAWVRGHASEYGIDPDRIGIVGFSAGAGVTTNVCFNHTEESRPNLVAPIYGGSLLGEIPSDAAPLFAAAPELDIMPGLTSIDFYSAWQGAGLPAELHYFAKSQHGFGYKGEGAPEDDWITLLYHFMQKTGFVPSGK